MWKTESGIFKGKNKTDLLHVCLWRMCYFLKSGLWGCLTGPFRKLTDKQITSASASASAAAGSGLSHTSSNNAVRKKKSNQTDGDWDLFCYSFTVLLRRQITKSIFRHLSTFSLFSILYLRVRQNEQIRSDQVNFSSLATNKWNSNLY